MDELVDILDSKGNPTGEVCMKSEAHLQGYWHPCIHVWLYTNDGKVLIQKRAATKKEFPDTWDVSVAGHIGAGEDLLLATQREVLEEVGVKLSQEDLKFIGNFKTDFTHNSNLIDREYHHIYIAELTLPIEALKIQVEEVSEIKIISILSLRKKLAASNNKINFVPYGSMYFNQVFNAIIG